MLSKSSNLRSYLLATAIITFLMIVAGYVLRFNPQGQVCPDWPTCYGQLAIPPSDAARLEMGHRVLAAVSGLMILIAAGWAWQQKRSGFLRATLTGAVALVTAGAAVGGSLVFTSSAVLMSATHLALALAAMGLITAATTAAFYEERLGSRILAFNFSAPFARLTVITAVVVFILMVSGGVTAALQAGQACSGWPLCNGGLPQGPIGWLALAHRVVTLMAGLLAVVLFARAWRTQYQQPVVLAAATAMGMLFAGQVLIGALKVRDGFPVELVGLHAAVTAGLWAILAVLMTAAGLTPSSRAPEGVAALAVRPGGKLRLRAFLMLNKPIIVALLLVTTYAGMVVGGKEIPGGWLTFWTLLGGALAAGGASALNQYVDRKIDGRMQRTAGRPLPSGVLTPAEGLAYGLGACLAAFFLLAGFVNLLAAVLSLTGMIYYVLVYSIWLKYATVQNIVIGGGAGAIPPLVGWAAATGSLNVPALFLFALVFMWTPPHFWALALVRSKDYARAGVPMLPVVKGEKETRIQIFIYTLELVGLTLLMPLFKVAGSIFLVSAIILGVWLIYTAWSVLRNTGNKFAWRMYRYSSMYLAFIFLALVVDVLV